MAQHFIDPTGPVAAAIDAILQVAGDNFTAPYDGNQQPNNVVEANEDFLLQYNMPGGSKSQGMANPAQGGSIGAAISTLLMLLSPFISAYALILPILGIIRGIIEVICALLNPFAIGPAVERLFKKWIPAFISLFPPISGGIIIQSTIKLIMAIIFFVMTEIIPTIELVIDNIEKLEAAFNEPESLTQAKIDASQEKFRNVIKTLVQKIGILSVMLPLLELIFLIINLVVGFPCSSDSKGPFSLVATLPFDNAISDVSCCDEDVCPEILSNRNAAPSGSGVLLQSRFGDCAPGFVFQILTSNPKVAELEQYQESFREQLNCQLDEPIKFARPAGATSDTSLMKIKIKSKRGQSREVTLPILDITGTTVKVTSPLAVLFLNQLVDYEIQPDYDMLVMHNIIGLACHPDIASAKESVANKFDLTPFLVKNPEVAPLLDDYRGLVDDYDRLMAQAADCVEVPDEPPFDQNITCLDSTRSEILDLSNAFIDSLCNMLTALQRSANPSTSSLEVNKRDVRADNTDFALITVTPKDIAGTLISQNLPDCATPAKVEIITDFGVVSNERFSRASGNLSAEIRSPITGIASVRAKVNNAFVTDFIDESDSVAIRKVRFVSDSALPIRRKKSKQSSGITVSTGTTSEREPR